MPNWLEKKCRSCEGRVPPLSESQVREFITSLPGWVFEGGYIKKMFEFKNFYETMAFANGVGWIADTENHHPDLELSYKKCAVKFKTHSINGISENDFIAASKVERLVQ